MRLALVFLAGGGLLAPVLSQLANHHHAPSSCSTSECSDGTSHDEPARDVQALLQTKLGTDLKLASPTLLSAIKSLSGHQAKAAAPDVNSSSGNATTTAEPAAANGTTVSNTTGNTTTTQALTTPSPAVSNTTKVKAAEPENLAGLVLLGEMAFVMVLFYMVNARSVSIVDNAWSMISICVSMFCAVMLNDHLNAYRPAEGAAPDGHNVALTAGMITVLYLLLIWVLFATKARLLLLKGFGTIGGHLLGLAAIKLCGLVATMEGFRGRPEWGLLVICLYVLFMIILFHIHCTRFLARLESRHGDASSESREIADQWYEQITDTGTDFFCLGASFLLCFYIRFMLTDKLPSDVLPSIDAVSHVHPVIDDIALFFIGSAMVFFAVSFISFQHADPNAKWAKGMNLASTTCSMTGVFCWLWAAHWYLSPKMGTSMAEHILVALVFSAVAIVEILVFAYLTSRAGADRRLLRGMTTASALAVGQSWEQVFGSALDNIPKETLNAIGGEVVAAMILLVIILPAWLFYMLPRGDDKLKGALGYYRD